MNGAAPTFAANALLRILQPHETPAIALLGLEQEFEVWRGDERIDFRDLIHELLIDGLRLDPGDKNAYRLRSGMAITCDEAEAEVVSPPIPLAPGFAAVVVGYADAARHALESLLPAGYSARGYSTHISVSWPGPPDATAAERYARTFGPLFGVLIDRAASNGVYVRPRPGRIELCGEFVEGDRLAAAVAFAAGSVESARSGSYPEEAALDLLPCQERFGFRVHRTACGFDLYSAGRDAPVPLAVGGSHALSKLLTQAWSLARPALLPFASAEDLVPVDRVVARAAPLGIEAGAEPPLRTAAVPPPSVHGLAVASFENSATTVAPYLATWDFSVFRVCHNGNERFLSVPARSLQPLFTGLERDADAIVAHIFDAPADELSRPRQTSAPGVFSSVTANRPALLPPEIPPPALLGESRAGKAQRLGRPGKFASARIGKMLLPLPARQPAGPAPEPPPPPLLIRPRPPEVSPPPPPLPPVSVAPQAAPASPAAPSVPVQPPPARPPWGLIGAVGAAMVGVAVVSGAILMNGSGGNGEPTPGATASPAPAATETSAPTATATATATVKPTETTPPTVSPAVATPSPSPTDVVPTQAAAATPTPTSTPSPTEPPTPAVTPTPTPTATVRPTETPRPTSTPTPTATATLFIPPIPTSAPTVAPTPCVPIPGANNCQ